MPIGDIGHVQSLICGMTYEDSPVAAVALFQLGVQSHGDATSLAK